jgi:hypothetical protein
MGPNRRAQERERAAARAATEAKPVEAEQRTVDAPKLAQYRIFRAFGQRGPLKLEKAAWTASRRELTISLKERVCVIARQG